MGDPIMGRVPQLNRATVSPWCGRSGSGVMAETNDISLQIDDTQRLIRIHFPHFRCLLGALGDGCATHADRNRGR